MEFKIENSIGNSGNGPIGKKLRVKPEEGAASPRGRASGTSSGNSDEAATLTISNNKNYADTAKNAVDAIAGLRAQQLKLAKEAAESPQDARTDELNEEVEVLQEEIERVASTATYNGINTLSSSRTLTSSIDENTVASRGQAVTIVNASSISNDLNIDLTSQEAARTAVENLEDTIKAVDSLSTGVTSATEKIESLDEESIVNKVEEEEEEDPSEEAKELSQDIALQLGSPFQTEEGVQELIETSTSNLDEDRVSSLLED